MQKSGLMKMDLPDTPGVYIFRGARRKVLYVGKATSLRSRVRSYFASDVAGARGERIKGMVEAARNITWEETDSVLEALILEANLIKKYQPPYNSREKDNKSFNYLVITKESFPCVIVVRGRELLSNRITKKMNVGHIFGPFPQGGQLKEALKIVRKIFPYRDKCMPCAGQFKTKNSTHTPMACKPCFNRQLGLCPGVCSGEISKTEYNRTIRHIKLLFSGKKKNLIKALEKEMRAYARAEQFEKAERTRRQTAALTHIRDVALIKRERISSGGAGVRIEAFDVAHIAGSDTVGVMAPVLDGIIVRDEIRRFRVRGVGNNDTAALTEIISRRLAHPEWPLPRVFVVDGGRAQMNSAKRVLAEAGIGVPVVGVVKDDRHRPRDILGPRHIVREHENDILLANNEAHARAITYHRLRRRKRFL
jgi:excinuclease ABC subunit C